jgi:hypothetical protein
MTGEGRAVEFSCMRCTAADAIGVVRHVHRSLWCREAWDCAVSSFGSELLVASLNDAHSENLRLPCKNAPLCSHVYPCPDLHYFGIGKNEFACPVLQRTQGASVMGREISVSKRNRISHTAKHVCDTQGSGSS